MQVRGADECKAMGFAGRQYKCRDGAGGCAATVRCSCWPSLLMSLLTIHLYPFLEFHPLLPAQSWPRALIPALSLCCRC